MVTRPIDDSVALAARLSAIGIDSLIEPLLKIRIFEGPRPDLSDIQVLLATSANGIRAFCKRSDDRNLAVFSVGDATGREALLAGFTDVVSAGGDVRSLAELVRHRLDPSRGPLLHIAGSEVAGDLAGMLAADGFEVRRTVLYATEIADRLSTEADAALRSSGIDGVLVFSPRTAHTLTRLLTGAGLRSACRRLTVFCLSEAVAIAVRELPWRSVVIASIPAEAALLRELAVAVKGMANLSG